MTVLKKIGVLLLFVCFIVMSEQQAVILLTQDESIVGLTTIIKIICVPTFPMESTNHAIIWEFKGQQLAVNGTRTPHVSHDNRTYVQYNELNDDDWKHSSILSIYGSVKNDERKGNYTCLAMYDIGDAKHIDKKTIFVPILYYLPTLEHPQCSASSLMVDEGGDVTFTCDPVDSNPPMNVTLVLQGPDGTETLLGSMPEITTMMTIYNNNYTFVCYMNSTFYTYVKKQCSSGPITVSPRSSTPTQNDKDSTTASSYTHKPNPQESSSTVESSSSSKPEVSTLKSQHPRMKSTSTVHPPASLLSSEAPSVEFSSAFSGYSTVTMNSNSTLNNTQFFTPITIGSFAAGFILITIILLITICLLFKRKKTSTKPSTSKDHPMDNIEKAASNAASTKTQDDSMQVYSEVDKDTPNPKTTSKASNHTNKPQDKSDQETNEDQEIPVYAISSMAGAADNTTGDKMTNEMPIYSQVNKGSDMVENMIYEPAGPM